jgi:hypothetical protein
VHATLGGAGGDVLTPRSSSARMLLPGCPRPCAAAPTQLRPARWRPRLTKGLAWRGQQLRAADRALYAAAGSKARVAPLVDAALAKVVAAAPCGWRRARVVQHAAMDRSMDAAGAAARRTEPQARRGRQHHPVARDMRASPPPPPPPPGRNVAGLRVPHGRPLTHNWIQHEVQAYGAGVGASLDAFRSAEPGRLALRLCSKLHMRIHGAGFGRLQRLGGPVRAAKGADAHGRITPGLPSSRVKLHRLVQMLPFYKCGRGRDASARLWGLLLTKRLTRGCVMAECFLVGNRALSMIVWTPGQEAQG